MKKLIYSLFYLLMLGQVMAQVPTNGLVAFYPFTGNVNDATGGATTGTNTNAVLTSDRFGVANSAYSFNGTNAFLNLGLNPSQKFNTNAVSVSIWVYITGNGFNYPRIFLGGRVNSSYTLTKMDGTDDRILWRAGFPNQANGSGQVISTNPLTRNAWHHIVATYDGVKSSIYVNGVFNGSTNIAGTLAIDNVNTSLIGGELAPHSGGTQNSYFTGSIDDFRLYNRALEPCEINQLAGIANPVLATPVFITTPPTSGCTGGLTNYSISAVPNAVSYQWSLDGVVVTGATGLTFSKSWGSGDAGNHTVSVVAKTTCVTSPTLSASITLSSPPQNFAITSSSNNYCLGLSHQFDITVNGAASTDPTINYFWNVPSLKNTPSSNQQSNNIILPTIPYYNTSTSLSIKALVFNGCGSQVLQKDLTINNNQPLFYLQNQGRNLVNSSHDGLGTPNIYWIEKGSTTKQRIGSNVFFLPADVCSLTMQNASSYFYAVSVYIEKSGCIYSSCWGNCGTNYFDGGIGSSGARISAPETKVQEVESYLIYPNPSTGTVTIETKGQIGKAYVFNTFGQVVAEVDLTKDETVYTVNLSAKGLYTFKIKADGETTGYKVVVE